MMCRCESAKGYSNSFHQEFNQHSGGLGQTLLFFLRLPKSQYRDAQFGRSALPGSSTLCSGFGTMGPR